MLFFQLPFLPERLLTPSVLRSVFRRTTLRKDAYGEEEIAANLEAMREPEGPLNYYRAALRFGGPLWVPVQAQTLVIWGERDPWLGNELALPEPKWVPHVRVERIAGASHWVQADAPAEVTRLLVEFLR